jgi:hypothetical protein
MAFPRTPDRLRSALNRVGASRSSLSRVLTVGACVATLATGVIVACSDSASPIKRGTFYGPVTTLSSGTARSYVTLNESGVPTDVGVSLTEGALVGLPIVTTEYVLALPAEASATPYKHVGVNWQPMGHPPVFMVPHFDVHFYMISEQERAAMTEANPQYAASVAKTPTAEFIPTSLIRGASDPRMGTHWPDPTGPEFNGQPFTHTFIYGSYDGTFIFGEPMITKTFLETKAAPSPLPIRLPSKYASPGHYPTTYSAGYDAATKEYHISLSGLVLR